jgi:hypothetical protein
MVKDKFCSKAEEGSTFTPGNPQLFNQFGLDGHEAVITAAGAGAYENPPGHGNHFDYFIWRAYYISDFKSGEPQYHPALDIVGIGGDNGERHYPIRPGSLFRIPQID